MAVEYLKILDKRPDLPPEIRDVWDLEMSKSLKAAAADAFDAKEYEQLMDESQKHLAKFIKEKPDHPAAATAMAAWGDFLVKRALELTPHGEALGRTRTRSRHAEVCSTDARTTLGRRPGEVPAGRREVQGNGWPRCRRRRNLPTKKPERAEAAEARERGQRRICTRPSSRLALIDYYLAQTIPIRRAPTARPRLKKAAKAFDDIFQQNRDERHRRLRPHVARQDGRGIGRLRPGAGHLRRSAGQRPRAQRERPRHRPGTAVRPGRAFPPADPRQAEAASSSCPRRRPGCKDYRRCRQTDGYQGIALEYGEGRAGRGREGHRRRKKANASREVLQIRDRVRQDPQPVPAGVDPAARANCFEEVRRRRTWRPTPSTRPWRWATPPRPTSQWDKALDAYDKALDIAEKTKTQESRAASPPCARPWAASSS